LKRYSKPLLFIAVAALVLASYFGCNRESNSLLFNCLGYSAVIVMSVGLLVWATIEKGWLCSVLTIRPLRYIGKISYMAYLIHLPMIELLQRLGAAHGILHGGRLAVASTPLTLLFASASWYLIERPILSWNRPNGKSAPEIASAAEHSGHESQS
jgi:peptidoglycan/LPS O-acetylase OafA/YrhL